MLEPACFSQKKKNINNHTYAAFTFSDYFWLFFLGLVFVSYPVWFHLFITQSRSTDRGELVGIGTAMYYFLLQNAAQGIQLVKTWCFRQMLETTTHSPLKYTLTGPQSVKIWPFEHIVNTSKIWDSDTFTVRKHCLSFPLSQNLVSYAYSQ